MQVRAFVTVTRARDGAAVAPDLCDYVTVSTLRDYLTVARLCDYVTVARPPRDKKIKKKPEHVVSCLNMVGKPVLQLRIGE